VVKEAQILIFNPTKSGCGRNPKKMENENDENEDFLLQQKLLFRMAGLAGAGSCVFFLYYIWRIRSKKKKN
jgi:hypothetical protein